MSTHQNLHVPLDSAPQAITLTVRALTQRVQRGGIRVPRFQRPLRWKAKHVTTLFDSILRGYPVGSLLFWKRPAEADPDYLLGSAVLPIPSNPDAWWIVDGQQRVTALAASLLDLNQGGDRRWTIGFDPRDRTFRAGAIPASDVGIVVPLRALGDLRRLGRWLRECRLDEAKQDTIEDVQQRILDYPLSAYLMETENSSALRGVFARMNSTGVRMRSDEVFTALLGNLDEEGVDLDALQESADIDGFGQPPRREILKAVLAISGYDPTSRPEGLGEQAANEMVSNHTAARAIESAVRFLQEDVGVVAYPLLPYPVVFVVLARWFHVFPDTPEVNRKRLARWLWRSVIAGVHVRANVSRFRRQVQRIEGEDQDAVLDGLESEVGEPARIDWMLKKFNASNAGCRVEVLALLSLHPRDEYGEIAWRSMIGSGERVAREIFASRAWKDLTKEQIGLAKTAANRVLLTSVHTGLENEIRAWDSIVDRDVFREILKSHLIDEEMFAALQNRDIVTFLRQRRDRLQGLVSAFLTKKAGIGRPLIRPDHVYFEAVAD